MLTIGCSRDEVGKGWAKSTKDQMDVGETPPRPARDRAVRQQTSARGKKKNETETSCRHLSSQGQACNKSQPATVQKPGSARQLIHTLYKFLAGRVSFMVAAEVLG